MVDQCESLHKLFVMEYTGFLDREQRLMRQYHTEALQNIDPQPFGSIEKYGAKERCVTVSNSILMSQQSQLAVGAFAAWLGACDGELKKFQMIA
jgi:hypothetical protein